MVGGINPNGGVNPYRGAGDPVNQQIKANLIAFKMTESVNSLLDSVMGGSLLAGGASGVTDPSPSGGNSPDAVNGAHAWGLLCEISLIMDAAAAKGTLTAAQKAKVTALVKELKGLQSKIPSTYVHLSAALAKLLPLASKGDVKDFESSWHKKGGTDNFSSYMLAWLQSSGADFFSDPSVTDAQKSDFSFYSNIMLLTVGSLPQYSADGTMEGYFGNDELLTNMPQYIFAHFYTEDGHDAAKAIADYQNFVGLFKNLPKPIPSKPPKPSLTPNYDAIVKECSDFGTRLSTMTEYPKDMVQDPKFFDSLGVITVQDFISN